jgi:hypothetical protein
MLHCSHTHEPNSTLYKASFDVPSCGLNAIEERAATMAGDGEGEGGVEEIDIADSPEIRAAKTRLVEMREEHRALDSAILALANDGGDALQLARLKKRKLALRDQIQWIEDRLTPDIIA